MYRFTLLICTSVLCINFALSAPPSLLSALLSQSQAKQKPETGLTTYDQKQTGKYNIHLNIKDVAIIALDAGQVDSSVGDFGEDYYEDYDLSDFTVKPIFGLIDAAGNKPSDKPTSTTAAPPLIHLDDVTSDEDTDTDTFNGTIIEEPILKDPVNKTQSVVILSSTPTVSILSDNNSSPSGITVTTPTPSPEDLPPKLSLSDLANVQSAQKPFQTKPNEIPVQIILEQAPEHKQYNRQRPNSNWHLRNRVRATPSSNRRITPPHDDFGTEY